MRIHSLFTPTAEQKAKFTHRPQHRGGVGGLGSLRRVLQHTKKLSCSSAPQAHAVSHWPSAPHGPPQTQALPAHAGPGMCAGWLMPLPQTATAPDSYGPSSGAPRPRDARFRRANSPSHHAGKAGCSLSHRGARLAGRWQYKSN